MKYNNLQALLASDQNANGYFSSLPEYVQEHIQTREQNVNSLDELKKFAENYLQGDK